MTIGDLIVWFISRRVGDILIKDLFTKLFQLDMEIVKAFMAFVSIVLAVLKVPAGGTVKRKRRK